MTALLAAMVVLPPLYVSALVALTYREVSGGGAS